MHGKNHAFQQRNLVTRFTGWQKPGISTVSFIYAVRLAVKNHALQQRNLVTLFIGWQRPGISTA